MEALDVAMISNTSYRIKWIARIVVNAVTGASGIKMTMRLGDMDYNGVKQGQSGHPVDHHCEHTAF